MKCKDCEYFINPRCENVGHCLNADHFVYPDDRVCIHFNPNENEKN
jgi:hypothetical protein